MAGSFAVRQSKTILARSRARGGLGHESLQIPLRFKLENVVEHPWNVIICTGATTTDLNGDSVRFNFFTGTYSQTDAGAGESTERFPETSPCLGCVAVPPWRLR